jgi:hypothetical protein
LRTWKKDIAGNLTRPAEFPKFIISKKSYCKKKPIFAQLKF